MGMLILRLFTLFFVLTVFPFTTVAMDLDNILQSKPFDMDEKTYLSTWRDATNQNAFHIINKNQFDQLVDIIGDDLACDLLAEKNYKACVAIDKLKDKLTQVCLDENGNLDARFATLTTQHSNEKNLLFDQLIDIVRKIVGDTVDNYLLAEKNYKTCSPDYSIDRFISNLHGVDCNEKNPLFDQLVGMVGESRAKALLATTTYEAYFAIDRFFDVENNLNPRLVTLLTTRLGNENYTLLMMLAMRNNIDRKLEILQSQGIDIDQTDLYGNTAAALNAHWKDPIDIHGNTAAALNAHWKDPVDIHGNSAVAPNARWKDPVDIHGNSAVAPNARWKDPYNNISIFMTFNNPDMDAYKELGLSTELLAKICNKCTYPAYIRRLAGAKSLIIGKHDFIAIVFKAIRDQEQTDAHHAFLLKSPPTHSVSGIESGFAFLDYFCAYLNVLR
ncbi:MAG: hypothetical protein K2W94_00755 [Alphaproteobacteria bacterium]|nr:hypothetical protein [Alphaproteobacteria bacterium]